MIPEMIDGWPNLCGSEEEVRRARAGVPEADGKMMAFANAAWVTSLTVRRSDHDFNNHVNNAHYVEWAFECLPDAWRETRRVRDLDIVYRAAARWGDTVISEAAQENTDTLLHSIRRASDGMVLALVRTVWQGEDR